MTLPRLPEVDYVGAGGAEGADPRDVLARVVFRAGAQTQTAAGEIVVPLDALADEPPRIERWRVDGAVEHGRDDELAWSCGGGWLMVSMCVAEEAHGGPEAAAAHAYRLLMSAIEAHGHPHLVRVWNYLADINDGEGDEERYRRFSVGRAAGMAHVPVDRFPAATAIGRVDGVRELVVFALAARQPGVAIENPRQVSAYRYPREYGPVPPSFARAMRVDAGLPSLLLSGTASVVGHATVHDRSCAQMAETLRNVDSLLACAGMPPDLRERAWIRAYLRDPADAAMVRDALAARGVSPSRVICLHGDICRRELLLEIDGIICG